MLNLTPTQTYFMIVRHFDQRLGLVFIQNALLRWKIEDLTRQIDETKAEIAKIRGAD